MSFVLESGCKGIAFSLSRQTFPRKSCWKTLYFNSCLHFNDITRAKDLIIYMRGRAYVWAHTPAHRRTLCAHTRYYYITLTQHPPVLFAPFLLRQAAKPRGGRMMSTAAVTNRRSQSTSPTIVDIRRLWKWAWMTIVPNMRLRFAQQKLHKKVNKRINMQNRDCKQNTASKLQSRQNQVVFVKVFVNGS